MGNVTYEALPHFGLFVITLIGLVVEICSNKMNKK